MNCSFKKKNCRCNPCCENHTGGFGKPSHTKQNSVPLKVFLAFLICENLDAN